MDRIALGPQVHIDYTNHRGERAVRRIRPRSIRFGCSEWHPDLQWLLDAFDVGKGEPREFAMKDIHAWGETALRTPKPARPSVEAVARAIWMSDNPGQDEVSWEEWVAYTSGRSSIGKDVEACRARARAVLARIAPAETPAREPEAASGCPYGCPHEVRSSCVRCNPARPTPPGDVETGGIVERLGVILALCEGHEADATVEVDVDALRAIRSTITAQAETIARQAPLREALERISAATPGNTNSRTAEDMWSWCKVVADCALDAAALAKEGRDHG